MASPDELLSAGALLSVKEKVRNESTIDTVSARVYKHPALGNRPVVRLVADNLAAGDDLTMEFLGFATPEVIGPIAKRQRQALGFPGWAIINDPKHARYALELVKEFKKAVRKSKAKPGHGYDEFVEISKRLGKSVAHFLPSFWEQVGREFIALDNATYASRAFGKAREAEKVHALKVDETLRQDAFLEFALAGAVSIKALTEYGKDLASNHDPVAAWTFFRELCVRRTLGGMPPWTSMVKDLTPLIKAAKLDLEDQIHRIIVEIIDSPAISRANMGFWDSAAKFVGSLVQKNAHVAGVLLNMIPQTSSWRTNDLWPWLDHLQTWGILENGWKESVPDGAGPTGGTAAWINRLIQSGHRLQQRLFDIVQAAAPRLIAEKQPLQPYQKARWGNRVNADVDLLDTLMDLKIPMTDPPDHLDMSLREWAVLDTNDKSAKNRPRDPVLLMADRRFTSTLQQALREAVGDANFEQAAGGKVALRQARHDWLNGVIAGLHNGALPGVESSLEMIDSKTSKAMFDEFPDVAEQFKAASILPAVARTLQTGIMDEYCWPLLEKVFADFAAAGHVAPSLFGQFPFLIVTDRLKTVVLQGDKIVHEAELKLPPNHKLKQLMYLDGDLLVTSGVDYQGVCFWNSDPQIGEPDYVFYPAELSGIVIDVPGGGTFVGEATVHKGTRMSKSPVPTDYVYSDGTHFWLSSGEYDPVQQKAVWSTFEVDRATGKKGRKSLPSFFENYIEEGWTLEIEKQCLLPFGSIFPKSMLGAKDGLIGHRRRRNNQQTVQLETVDGRRTEFSSDKNFDGLLNQVETNATLAVQSLKSYRNSTGYKFWDPTQTFEVSEIKTGVGGYNRGQPTALPWLYLHAYQVRDAAASKKLRQVTDADVQKFLDSERMDIENFRAGKVAPAKSNSVVDQIRGTATGEGSKSPILSESEHFPLLDAAIAELLGKNSQEKLRIGIRGIIVRAGQKIRELAKLVERRTTVPAHQAAAVQSVDEVAVNSFASFIGARYRSLPGRVFSESLNNLTEFLAGKSHLTHFPPQWFGFLNFLVDGIPERLWSAFTNDPNDKSWIAFAESWCHAPFAQLKGAFRRYSGEAAKDDFLKAEIAAVNEGEKPPDSSGYAQAWPIPVVGRNSRFLLNKSYRDYDVLEYSPDGNFETLPDFNVREDSVSVISRSIWSSEQLAEFIRLAQSKSPAVPSLTVLKSISERVRASVAEVAMVWFGLPNFDAYQANFMPAHLRDSCKLKTRDCAAAKEALKSLPKNTLKSIVRAVIDGNPAELWEEPPTKAAERLCLVWGGESERIPLSAEWLEKLSDAFGYGVDKHRIFTALNSPSTNSMFNSSYEWTIGQKGKLNRQGIACSEDSLPTFDEGTLRAATLAIAMLAYGLPSGDPARNRMREVYEAVSKVLASPKLILLAGWRHDYDAKQPDRTQKLVESLLGALNVQEGLSIADNGTVAVAIESYQTMLTFRPAMIRTDAEHEKVQQILTALTAVKSEDNPNPADHPALKVLQNFRIIKSADFQGLVARIESTPVPPGQFEANPLLSAPDVVKAVVKKSKLSEEAATWYLQLLTLPDPTDKNIQLWNGWTSAQLKTLSKELVDKGVVLEATRSRAGRKLFLPGGWEDLKAPHLPLETWKMPLFQMTRDAYQRATPPLSRIVPLEPLHTLFARAWKRIVDGDVPKYEEVK